MRRTSALFSSDITVPFHGCVRLATSPRDHPATLPAPERGVKSRHQERQRSTSPRAESRRARHRCRPRSLDRACAPPTLLRQLARRIHLATPRDGATPFRTRISSIGDYGLSPAVPDGGGPRSDSELTAAVTKPESCHVLAVVGPRLLSVTGEPMGSLTLRVPSATGGQSGRSVGGSAVPCRPPDQWRRQPLRIGMKTARPLTRSQAQTTPVEAATRSSVGNEMMMG